jgi:hypothetical protein
MEHCAEDTVVDLVRGVGTQELARRTKAHLDAGCSPCATNYALWRRVERFAFDETTYRPPNDLVRLVKLGFAQKSRDERSGWTVASLVFDGFKQPLPAGVRSGLLNVWQVIYEAEGLTVDLRFGRRAQSKAVHLVGQVFDRLAVRALRNNATVELSTDTDATVATTSVSDFGEFHLEYEAKDQLWLSVRAEGRNTVRIPLTNPR